MAVRFSVRAGDGLPLDGSLLENEIGLVVTQDVPGTFSSHPLLVAKTGGIVRSISSQNTNELGEVPAVIYARTDGTPGDAGIIPAGKYLTGTLGESHIVGGIAGTAVFQGDIVVLGSMVGTATTALYADIAEYYVTEFSQEPGDILMIGSEFETTVADGSMPIAGVCSTSPAYTMNDGLVNGNIYKPAARDEDGVIIEGMFVDSDGEIKLKEDLIHIAPDHYAPLALKGRVPVKITGSAKRGQYIILDSENPGIGIAVDKISAELDRDCVFVGVCITEGTDVCEVKI